MRNRASTTGRLLRSVALRYRQPCSQFAERTEFACNQITYWSGKKTNKPPLGGGNNARDDRLAQVEAILFLSSQPVGSRKLAQLADLADGTKARTLVRKLNRLYDAEGSAFRAEEVAGGFQLLTRAKFASWLRRLHSAAVEVRLSGPAMETLAVVAYRQPVLRAEIEAIRGVQSGEVLRQLIERDMVRIVGRSDELGRPFLYGTGKKFLQVFGLRHLDELPQTELIQYGAAGLSCSAEPLMEIPKPFDQFPEAEEEKNVKTLTTTKARPEFVAEEPTAALMEPERRKLANREAPYNQIDEDEDFEEDEEEDEDFEDEEFDDLDDDDDEEEEAEEDEELDDEWEEVDDDEEEEDDDEDWDDEDWDDDDWDDDEEEDDDFDDDEDEEEEEEEEED
jgi:segregation and condensation protein B